jgi:hypothetical protein
VSAPDTREAFHDALRAYDSSAASAGQGATPAELAADSGLLAAARAHVKAARPLEDIKAEYDALQAAQSEGEAVDGAALQDLADELQPARMAIEVLRGNYPGTGHTASAGIGA